MSQIRAVEMEERGDLNRQFGHNQLNKTVIVEKKSILSQNGTVMAMTVSGRDFTELTRNRERGRKES